MVFTKLSVQEKDAFFGLLDEYFQSRPELFGQDGNGQGMRGLAGTGVSTAAATSVVQRALATAGNATGPGGGGAGGASGKSTNPYAASMLQPNSADLAHAVTVGRVAAASLAFSGGQPHMQSQIQPAGKSGDPPPSLPRRATSNAPQATPLDRISLPGAEVDKLASVFSAFKKPESAGVTIPSAFAPPKNTFGPPPVRRATSETSTGTNGGAVGTRSQRQAVPESESEVAEGEWVEVLYDYTSEDPGDLEIEAGTRVLVIDKSSDDWSGFFFVAVRPV
ncbi:hypothetical protein J3R82DRAFT_3888 [Butyriboletus roseoflavus]|nr:hypothetical protein J3R82DRAFT_3888 [Butyriboletus roseoflavus]